MACLFLALVLGMWKAAGADPEIFGRETNERICEEIREECRRLDQRKRAREFPPAGKVSETPPPWATEAMPPATEAWLAYRRFREMKLGLADGVARGRWDVTKYDHAYRGMLGRLVEGEDPPEVNELMAFGYHGDGWCATPDAGFARTRRLATILADLRNDRPRDAMVRSATDFHPALSGARDDLLNVFGFDPVRIDLGAWLDGKDRALEPLMREADDAVARIIIHQVGVMLRQASASPSHAPRGLLVPGTEILQLFRPDNEVSEETKRDLVELIARQGDRLAPLEDWLDPRSRPEGTERWLVALARDGLDDPRDRVKRLAADVLRSAGEDFEAPEFRGDARFFITVNGEPWEVEGGPADRVRSQLLLDYGKGVSGRHSVDLHPLEQAGIFAIDGDHLFRGDRDPELPEKIRFSHEPGWGRASPEEPWLSASIPLPLEFPEIAKVGIRAHEVLIRPRYERPPEKLKELTSLIEFAPFDPEEAPQDRCRRYHVPANEALRLSVVSEGDYWVRISSAGSGISSWRRIRVAEGRTDFTLTCPVGATVVVPVKWSGATGWPGGSIYQKGGRPNPLFFRLTKDGSLYRPAEKVPPEVVDAHPSALVLAHLPAGDYLLTAEDLGGSDTTLRGFEDFTVRFRVEGDSSPITVLKPLGLRLAAGDSR